MDTINRRRLVLLGAAGVLALGCAERAPAKDARADKEAEGEDVAPPEDLMREHGVLDRLLLVYEESARRLEADAEPPPTDALLGAAGLIRGFIEDYHEKLEEDFLFPRFEQKGTLVELVATLREQHHAGRALTEELQRMATPAALRDAAGKKKIVAVIRAFVRMYRPHAAREDTVLFPALRSVVTPKEFDALGEQFEDKEHELFGKAGFEGIVVQVGKLEESLGIYNLRQFTPT